MQREYLATGFAHVDECDDTSAYQQCLALLDSLPYFRAYKERSYEWLDLSAGLTILEVGCGLGDDVLRIGRRVGENGMVVGVDASARMIEQAMRRIPPDSCTRFARADARDLPFKDNTFDRCRIDRTLQHIEDPRQVVREMVRVLQPKGMLLAYDNDWGTFSVNGSNDESTRIIETLWEDSFKSRWIGRYLKRYFLEAGLQDVAMEPLVSLLTDFELADRIYNLRQTVARAVKAGRLLPRAAEQWLLEAQAVSLTGGFVCTLTAYLVMGTKPDRQH